MTEVVLAPAGLAGVVAAETALGGVRGSEGFYHYRQYSAVELARSRSLEDVWFLLHAGHLPDASDAGGFRQAVSTARRLPAYIEALLTQTARIGPADAPALTWLRTGMSLVAHAAGLRSWLDGEDPATEALELTAQVPTVTAAMWRARTGRALVSPHDALATAANILWMLEGEIPAADRARALEQYLILTVDHGFNASTFAARVVASSGADLGSALVAGIGALSGPLHGGAPSLVVDMLYEIGSLDAARSWVRSRLERGEVIMGFGHRVYRTEDPRAATLREIARGMGGSFVELALGVEEIVLEELERHRPGRALRTNVEFYAGVVLNEIGLDPQLYPALFAMSRSIGWAAHVVEQIGNNRIYRPTAAYVGPAPPVPVPPVSQVAG